MQKCEVCQESQNTQAKETLEPHEAPTRPWQVVGTDLFSWDGDEYLLLCDYYSKFPIIKKIPRGQSTGNTVVNLTKCVFSEQGVPEVIISDNGPQLQGILQEVGFPAYYVKSKILIIQWIHRTTHSNSQTHFRQG